MQEEHITVGVERLPSVGPALGRHQLRQSLTTVGRHCKVSGSSDIIDLCCGNLLPANCCSGCCTR